MTYNEQNKPADSKSTQGNESNYYGSGKGNKKNRKNQKPDGSESYSSTQAQEKEGNEEETSGEQRGAGAQKFNKAAKRAMEFIEERTQDMDKASLTKYAAVGLLLLMGIRKTGFIGGLFATVAAGIVTKAILENTFDFFEEEGGEEKEERKGEAAYL